MMAKGRGRVCVIGAGASGLASAKAMMEAGFQVDVLEREHELGGIWNAGQPCGRVYRSTHTISSKPTTQYADFPMPEGYPDYPHHTQMLAYLRAYAARFGVDPHIEYDAAVARVSPAQGQTWDVELERGEVRRYDAVVVANGHNWCPRPPSYPGQFHGRSLHSAEYRTPDIFDGRRVLVVGAGNSGCDIAVDAARGAEAVFHSTRRGYHYIPKYAFGRPADQVGDLMHRLRLPLPIRRVLARLMIRLVVGPAEETGLPKPDHRLFETHPIVNSLLPYHVRHGDVKPKPDVARLESDGVQFVDGSREAIDLIVYATGYQTVFPFLEPGIIDIGGNRPRLYKNVFHPAYDTLFVVGLIQPNSGEIFLLDWQARAIAVFLRAARQDSASADWLRARKLRAGEELGGGIRYRDSPRHALEVEHWSYFRDLRRIVKRLERDVASAPPRAPTQAERPKDAETPQAA